MESLLPSLSPFPPLKITGDWLFCFTFVLPAVETWPYGYFDFMLFRATYR